MKRAKSLSRIHTIASIRASLNRLTLHEEDSAQAIKRTSVSPMRSATPGKVGKKRGASHLPEIGSQSSQKRFEPNIQVQRKRETDRDRSKEDEFLMKLKYHFDEGTQEESQRKQPHQEEKKGKGENKSLERPAKKQILVPGKMILGSKAETEVEKSKIIEKQKKEKKKQDKAKVDDNSWIHTSASSVNSYKPTVLPFFNNFTTEKKLKKEVKKLKGEGASQKEIEGVLANYKEEAREKETSQILLQESGEPDQDELFYLQLPKTLPFKQKLQDVKSGTNLGKLQILKSGKAKLVFENGLELEIRRGIESAFFQEAAILDHEKKEARMLGSVGNKLVLSPELRRLFGQN